MSKPTIKPVCQGSLRMIGDYWTMMIIDRLRGSPLRFRDLEAKIEGSNAATLTNRLKFMQTMHLIERHEHSRADVSYQLTELGKQVLPVLDAINKFSEFSKNYFPEVSKNQHETVVQRTLNSHRDNKH